jgi:hypothetical protein
LLFGLSGVALPVLIHLLNRRRDQVVDWGAMQFLDLGRRAQQRIRLTELVLMLARMTILALVSLALARPFWMPATAGQTSIRNGAAVGTAAPPRDVVLVVDGSDSMERRRGGTTPHAGALRWARRFVAQLRPGDSVAILTAASRIDPLIDPPTFDRARADAVLRALETAPALANEHGSSDLPAALAEAFRVLERTSNPGRDVIVLTDGQRSAWRPDEARRWSLIRDLQRRLPVPPRVWALAMGAGVPSDGPNGAVSPLVLTRALVTPGLPIIVTTTLTNAGPGPLSRTAELLADARPVPGSAQAIGPIAAGGRTALSFRTTLATPGTHQLAVRLVGGVDALPSDDEAATTVTVTSALPVLLVDGKPGLEPYQGAADFLRAALAPAGDDTPQVKASVVTAAELDAASLRDRKVVVLASVDRLAPAAVAALGLFVDAGGGLLVALGDRADAAFYNRVDWMPAQLGTLVGDPLAHRPVAHPRPATFHGPVLVPFAEGDAPPLAETDCFYYHTLRPAPDAVVAARFGSDDPWVIEGRHGRGHVLLLATSLDSGAGTLPVNPDFVPLMHEWVFHLAAAPVTADEDKSHTLQRQRESDPTPLDPAEAARLAEGWPLAFEADEARLDAHIFAVERGGRRELWHGLVLAALAGLCVEVYVTRRLVRSQGLGEEAAGPTLEVHDDV